MRRQKTHTDVIDEMSFSTCCVCLSDNDIGTFKLGCGHFFHGECLAFWDEQYGQSTMGECPACNAHSLACAGTKASLSAKDRGGVRLPVCIYHQPKGPVVFLDLDGVLNRRVSIPAIPWGIEKPLVERQRRKSNPNPHPNLWPLIPTLTLTLMGG